MTGKTHRVQATGFYIQTCERCSRSFRSKKPERYCSSCGSLARYLAIKKITGKGQENASIQN